MGFTRVNLQNGGFSQGETITPNQINTIDFQCSRAVDGYGGGIYAPSSPIILNGTNAIVSRTDGSIYLEAGNTIKRSPKTTAFNQPISGVVKSTGVFQHDWIEAAIPNSQSSAFTHFYESAGYGCVLNLFKVGQPFGGVINSVSITYEVQAFSGGGTKGTVAKFYRFSSPGNITEMGTLGGSALNISTVADATYTHSLSFDSPLPIGTAYSYFLSVKDDLITDRIIRIKGWVITATQTDIYPV